MACRLHSLSLCLPTTKPQGPTTKAQGPKPHHLHKRKHSISRLGAGPVEKEQEQTTNKNVEKEEPQRLTTW